MKDENILNMERLTEAIIDVEAALNHYNMLEKGLILQQVAQRIRMAEAKIKHNDVLHSNPLYNFASKMAGKLGKKDDEFDDNNHKVK